MSAFSQFVVRELHRRLGDFVGLRRGSYSWQAVLLCEHQLSPEVLRWTVRTPLPMFIAARVVGEAQAVDLEIRWRAYGV